MMKIKFQSFGNVNSYIKLVHDIESDVLITSGKFAIDGKSELGLYSLDLSKELELEITEKIPGESEKLIRTLDTLGIIIHDK